MESKHRKLIAGCAKFGISFAILSYLFYRAGQDESFSGLAGQPKNWPILAAALALGLTAILTTMLRWYGMVRALDLPFRIRDAFRLGFIGYFFSFLTLGVMGGDTLKAIFIAREQPDKKTEAVASVIVDRVIGLYALCVMAAVAFWVVDFPDASGQAAADLETLKNTGRTVFAVCLAMGGVFLAMLVVPALTGPGMQRQLGRLPLVGSTLGRLTAAAALYRRRAPVVVGMFLLSLVTHFCFSSCVYLVALGLNHPHPSFELHFAIVPIANVIGSLPLPGGLGGFEFAIYTLYKTLAPAIGMNASHGFVVALGYRIITLVIAGIGVVVYLFSRHDIKRLMAQNQPETA